jgi:hypothetical protein
MVVKRFLAALAVALVSWPFAAAAFDGNRKGIVLGGGVGLSPTARWSTELASESKFGVGLHFFAGYAWDEQNMIGCENNGTVYHSNYYNSDSLVGSGDLLTAQGFQGASWYHYWGQSARASLRSSGWGSVSSAGGRATIATRAAPICSAPDTNSHAVCRLGSTSRPGEPLMRAMTSHIAISVYWSAALYSERAHGPRHLCLPIIPFAPVRTGPGD